MEKLLAELAAFFTHDAPLAPGDRLLVAFSGGPDSLALLAGLTRLAAIRDVSLHALHLDHALDAGSSGRAAAAERLAARLRVPCTVERRPVGDERHRRESLEEAARRVRYAVLEACRVRIGARWTVTAHHRDDQAETVLLRLLGGSGWAGLAGIAAVRGAVVRPLLGLPRERLRWALARSVVDLGLEDGLQPVLDPTNELPAPARNRLRHHLLPWLAAREPGIVEQAVLLAAAATAARSALERRLAPALAAEGIPLAWLRSLPLAVRREALWLAARRGGGVGPRASSLAELERQLAGGTSTVGCDAGAGFVWTVRGDRLRFAKRPESTGDFSYTVAVPGWLEIPQAQGRIRLRPATGRTAGSPPTESTVVLHRGAPEGSWGVRNRRPGDRLRPEGAPGTRKLKELLIDRKVPADERSHLPLLCRGEEIVWVPGVTVAAGWRALPGEPGWLVEWERT